MEHFLKLLELPSTSVLIVQIPTAFRNLNISSWGNSDTCWLNSTLSPFEYQAYPTLYKFLHESLLLKPVSFRLNDATQEHILQSLVYWCNAFKPQKYQINNISSKVSQQVHFLMDSRGKFEQINHIDIVQS